MPAGRSGGRAHVEVEVADDPICSSMVHRKSHKRLCAQRRAGTTSTDGGQSSGKVQQNEHFPFHHIYKLLSISESPGRPEIIGRCTCLTRTDGNRGGRRRDGGRTRDKVQLAVHCQSHELVSLRAVPCVDGARAPALPLPGSAAPRRRAAAAATSKHRQRR